MNFSKMIVAGAIAVSGICGFGGLAGAAPPAANDPVECTEGVLSVVIDDSGVQHEACVASAAEVPAVAPVLPVPTEVSSVDLALLGSDATSPSTTVATDPNTPQLPETGAGGGLVVIAAILVCSGSLVSLVARRRG